MGLTPFLHHRFLRDLTVKKTPLDAIVFHLIIKLILAFSLSLLISFHQIIFSSIQSNKKIEK